MLTKRRSIKRENSDDDSVGITMQKSAKTTFSQARPLAELQTQLPQLISSPELHDDIGFDGTSDDAPSISGTCINSDNDRFAVVLQSEIDLSACVIIANEHQKCRFFCYKCEHVSVTHQEMEKHFANIHLCESTDLFPLNPNNYDTSSDLFVVCPPKANLNSFFKRLMKRSSNLQVNKRKFHPHEIELLPKIQIFHEKLECALCGYRNLVRQNLVRHFKLGCNEQQANSSNQSN